MNISSDNPTINDLINDFIVSDIPYSTLQNDNPNNVNNPQPDIPIGRVFAEDPYTLVSIIDAYETSIRIDENTSNSSLFHLDSDCPWWQIGPCRAINWEWYGINVYQPLLATHFQHGEISLVPPFEDDHYYQYNGNVVGWTSADVVEAIPNTDIGIISSHGSWLGNQTQSGLSLGRTNYEGMSDSTGNILVNGGCHTGLSLSHNSPSNNYDAFNNAIVNSILEKELGYFAPSTWGWYVTGDNGANILSPLA